jgi:dienelactone hydrolase
VARQAGGRGGKLVASVDFYAGCGASKYPVVVPLLVLVGALDTFNRGGGSCLALAEAYPTLVTVEVYPGACHGFDDPGGGLAANYFGFRDLIGDATAAASARVRVTAFLRRYMQ